MSSNLWLLNFSIDRDKIDLRDFIKEKGCVEDFIYSIHLTDKDCHCHLILDFGKNNVSFDFINTWFSIFDYLHFKSLTRTELLYSLFYVTNCRNVDCKLLEIYSTKGFEVF